MNKLLENYLDYLYQNRMDQAEDWRGPNIPYGDDSNRPQLIDKCLAISDNRMKINCLRKLRDQVSMNPIYQRIIDRFVDDISGNYDDTDEQGTIPGNDFKSHEV